ncbi:MAG TPA: alpha/beta fold hydrolase [Vicinamibacteria bacterium]|nr:alpha/beta fold hydrolase [Vicinamibacteria bacterium]
MNKSNRPVSPLAGWLLAAACALPTLAAAQAASGSSGVSPLLDRELFFGNPEIAAAQLSPDGRYIAFLKPWKDTRNVWVKKTAEPYSAGRLVTADARRPIPGFFWSRDSKYVLFVQDKDGDENYNVYAVDPAAPAGAGQETPPARNITDAKGARAFIYAVPKADPDVIYVGLNDRDQAWHDVYQVRISTGERTLVRQNTERIAGWNFDLSGRLRLAERIADNGDTEVLRIDPSGLTKVYTCTVFEACGVRRFHKDGKRTYMETNKGDTDLSRLVLLDAETGKEEVVESDPLRRVDFGNASFSEATDELVATSYQDDRTRVYFRDKAFEADYRLLERKLPEREISIGSSTADDRLWFVTATSDVDPGERYLFDRRTKALTSQYKVRERIPREHMAAMKAIRYASSDGLEIPAFLTLPRGVAAKGLPVIVLPHGGPWARDNWGFSNLAQFLANRGYAVLQPNFRGSTGYGKTFLNAGNRQWGDRMQDDITWGVKHLVGEGIADPRRVGIMGGSYGGYATLAGVAFTPDLYAAAVSIVGPSNLITLLDSIPPYWEAGRIIFHERLGNPKDPEGRKQLERQSPLNSAARIRTPLLVAQGANDPRVKKAESEQIVIALRDRGFPVEYVLAPDEGHGFARPVNSMSLFAATEAFFQKHLGGRVQTGLTPELTTRLREITVDPRTVVLTAAADPAKVGAPTPASDLAPGTSSYKGTLAAGGQNMPVTLTRTVKEDARGWVVTTNATMPMGEAVDTTVVETGSLVVTGRSVKQGPVEVELTFKDGKATGTFSMNGQSKPIDAEVGGAVFADGAAASDALAHLPLADGYSATFRNFDLQKQKVALKQVKVMGTEDVSVPAGTFKAWKVEVTSAEGEPGAVTLWIATDSRKVVKTSASLPSMGGAVLTAELQP